MLAQLRSLMLTAGFVAISAYFAVNGSRLAHAGKRDALVRYLQRRERVIRILFALCGIRIRYDGFDEPLRAAIVAANHESWLDTVIGHKLAAEPAYWMKKELFGIPYFGVCAKCVGMISVNRAGSPREAIETLRASRKTLEQGRCVIIFPEGTRRSPAVLGDYHAGIFALYDRTQGKYPVHVVVHNTGDFVRNRGDVRNVPWFGTIRIVQAGVIDEVGLSEREFMQRIEGMIRTHRALLEQASQKRLGAIGRWFTLKYLFPIQY